MGLAGRRPTPPILTFLPDPTPTSYCLRSAENNFVTPHCLTYQAILTPSRPHLKQASSLQPDWALVPPFALL